MTTARIARGGSATTRRAPVKKSGSRGRSKAKHPGLLDTLPISPKTVRKLATWGIVSAAVIVAIAIAFAFRIPQRIGTAIGEQIGAAGFTVSRVELRGLDRIDPSAITKTALDQPSLAMPLVDLDAIRDGLMNKYKWIKEARVHRRWPDTLVVEIVERTPAAVWQLNGDLQLVDGDGVKLEPVRRDAIPANLPLIIGPGAERRIAGLNALLEAVPAIREHFAGATWIGERRWDLRFKTGEILSLPEDAEAAKAALQRFTDMNARQALLGTGTIVRFDMRIEDRMIVQRKAGPPTNQARVPASAPGPARPAQQPPQDLSRTI